MDCRNYIIELFYEQRDKYLTATDCVMLLAEDSCYIIRIHSFLDHWGIINNYFDFESQNISTTSYIGKSNLNKLNLLTE